MINILFADDNTRIMDNLKFSFENKNGCKTEFILVESSQGIEQIHERLLSDEITVLVIDAGLPITNGLKFCKIAKQLSRGRIKTIIFSRYAIEAHQMSQRTRQAVDLWLNKTITNDDLWEKIKNICSLSD